MKAVLYVHGKGGSAKESEHYKPLFPDCDVVGLDYRGNTEFLASREIRAAIKALRKTYGEVVLVANSIGAYYSIAAGADVLIERAFFISPVVDMARLIEDMLRREGATEETLREKGTITTAFGETLSWEYLTYVRAQPFAWRAPTHILYGENDALVSYDTLTAFAEANGATLTVMPGGEHWFHTAEQMRFLDDWIVNATKNMLRLREWRETDAADLAEALSNPKILRNLRDGIPYPYTEQDGAAYIAYVRAANPDDAFVFALTVGDKAVGNVGVFRQADRKSGEIGYYLHESHWGNGLMTEAVRETCAYVFSHSDILRIYAEVFPDNDASRRVLEKSGFTYEGTKEKAALKNGAQKDVVVYARYAEEKDPVFLS